jgi:nicotinamide-nucleotide amidase
LHLSNAEKNEILGVSEDLIKEKTVVSEEVAQAMSLGCQKLFKTDIALSTTGVAGLILMSLNSK